jgi:hypothetical protein
MMRRGKGSHKHTMIQRNIQNVVREMGHIAVIEPLLGTRNADLLVHNPQTLETTIIEIELHKNYQHAFKSIRADLRYCSDVVVICGNETILGALNRLIARLHAQERKRVHFVLINQYIDFIRTLFQNKNNKTTYSKTQNKIGIAKDLAQAWLKRSSHGQH